MIFVIALFILGGIATVVYGFLPSKEEKEAQALTTIISGLETKISILTKERQQQKLMSEAISGKDKALHALTQEKHEMQTRCRQLENELAQEKTQVKQLQERIDAYAAQLQERMAVCTAQQVQGDDEKRTLRQTITTLEAKINDLTVQLEEQAVLVQGVTAKDDELAVLQEEIKKLNVQHKDAQKKLQKESERADALGQAFAEKEKMLLLEKEALDDTVRTLQNIIEELNNEKAYTESTSDALDAEEKERLAAAKDKREYLEYIKIDKNQKRKLRIGEILLRKRLITPKVLDEALEYKQKFGGEITKYLLAFEYVNEEDLAKCLMEQFRVPYFPLKNCAIPDEVIHLIPSEIAIKYQLVPVDHQGNVITLVMAHPLDEQVIKEVEAITNCTVFPTVGIISEITESIQRYYNAGKAYDDRHVQSPLFVASDHYKGIERRSSIRLPVAISASFSHKGKVRTSVTKDVSFSGLAIECKDKLMVGSFMVFQIKLPEEFCVYPIAIVAQVMRVSLSGENKFTVGLRVMKIPKEDRKILLQYAYLQQADAS